MRERVASLAAAAVVLAVLGACGGDTDKPDADPARERDVPAEDLSVADLEGALEDVDSAISDEVADAGGVSCDDFAVGDVIAAAKGAVVGTTDMWSNYHGYGAGCAYADNDVIVQILTPSISDLDAYCQGRDGCASETEGGVSHLDLGDFTAVCSRGGGDFVVDVRFLEGSAREQRKTACGDVLDWLTG